MTHLQDLSSIVDETTIRLAAPHGWDDTVTIKRTFGRRHDEVVVDGVERGEPIQPLVRISLTSGEDAGEQFECWLTLPEAEQVRDRLTAVIEQGRL